MLRVLIIIIIIIIIVSLGARAIRAMCRRRADLMIENLTLLQQGCVIPAPFRVRRPVFVLVTEPHGTIVPGAD